MNVLHAQAASLSEPEVARPIVIVGNGPVGVRIAQELLRLSPQLPLVIYGREQWQPYNRVRLSSLLAGDVAASDIDNQLVIPVDADVQQFYGCAVTRIVPDARMVIDQRGRIQQYRKLVLAMGSLPHRPAIPGIDLLGVFCFRDMNDAQHLMARRVRSRRTVILGGGLLGLEAARAMQRHNTEVSVIDHMSRLMHRQLDVGAAEQLHEAVMGMGLRLLLGDGVRRILGEREVTGIELLSGRTVTCDTIIVAAGIRPTITLARYAGLQTGQGIKVDDALRTANPDIYAVGECAEHRGVIYGLAAPGFEQAAVAAHNIVGGQATYSGSIAATRLKVVGQSVFSMGTVGDDVNTIEHRELVYRNARRGIYRKIVLRHRRLIGAVALGDWPELNRVQEAISNGRSVWMWQLRRFKSGGTLWFDQEAEQVAQWPATATVCNCTGVSRGQLSAALAQGCTTPECLAQRTGASTVCGSCKPLLAQLVGDSNIAPVKGAALLLTLSLIAAAIVGVTLVAGPWPNADTVTGLRPERLWQSALLKQITGFTLVGLVLIGLALSLRKRVSRVKWGDFAHWRIVHSALGLGAFTLLLAHTGLHLGSNLNAWFGVCFLGVGFSGAFSGLVTAREHQWTPRIARRARAIGQWSHVLLAWPLPALLTFHILAFYYF